MGILTLGSRSAKAHQGWVRIWHGLADTPKLYISVPGPKPCGANASEAKFVTAANMQDRAMIAPMMAVVHHVCSTVERCIADGGYHVAATAAEVLELAGIPLEIVKRSDTAHSIKVLPKTRGRRTHIGLARRLARARQGIREAHARVQLRHPGHDRPHVPSHRKVQSPIMKVRTDSK